jgi:membrane-associated phospholipid phosphatase
MTAPTEASLTVTPTPARRQRWWLELPFAVAFYLVYAQIRDWHGDATEHSTHIARVHGFAVLHAEQWLHLDLEQRIQKPFIHHRHLMIGFNVFYGSFHFIFTCSIFLWLLFRGTPERFRKGRNILAIATAIALVVFALYPTMPPRLMPHHVRTFDTMYVYGGLWSYNNGVVERIADPYAALPSLHIAWASWVAYVLASSRTSRWRYLFWIYPIFTSFAVIVTGVHWVLDLVAGAVVFVIALWMARGLEKLGERRGRGQPTEDGKASTHAASSLPVRGDSATIGDPLSDVNTAKTV